MYLKVSGSTIIYPYSIQILTQLFDNENALSNLENFVSTNGANHYDLSLNKEKIKFLKLKTPLILKNKLFVNGQSIEIFDPGFPIFWNFKNK